MGNSQRICSRLNRPEHIHAVEQVVGGIRFDRPAISILQGDSGSAYRQSIVMPEKDTVIYVIRTLLMVVRHSSGHHAGAVFLSSLEMLHNGFREVISLKPAEIVIKQTVSLGDIIVI